MIASSSAAMGMTHAVKPQKPFLASDHACFVDPGKVPAVLALSTGMDDHPGYHTPRDTAALISKPALAASLDLLWPFLLPVAMGTEGAYDLPAPAAWR